MHKSFLYCIVSGQEEKIHDAQPI